ncbi:autoinducer binding domain-containing protein [Rhodobacter sp. NSM]|uniref:autoinducer binding domain-containing protein n=1 Tax=Rhodobacter sp. NSM TaxID=3457501 RepID=UPI003FD2B25F
MRDPATRDLWLETLLAEVQALATAGHYIALHIRALQPQWVSITYPQAWTDFYLERSLAIADPSVTWALHSRGVRRWSEFTDDPMGVMAGAASHGLKFGAVFSVGPGPNPSICGLGRHDREFSEAELGQLIAIISEMHALLDESGPTLTTKQVDALRLIEQGCRQQEAATRLGISLMACKIRLNGARRALGAKTTTEAVAKACSAGLL